MIYFIRAGDNGPVKIGFAHNVKRRLAEVQNWAYHPLALLREMPGYRNQEMWLHRYFRSQHIRGEWFMYSEEMTAIVPHGPQGQLARWMDEQGISQVSLFLKFGMTAVTVSKICSGQKKPTPKFIEGIERLSDGALPATMWAA